MVDVDTIAQELGREEAKEGVIFTTFELALGMTKLLVDVLFVGSVLGGAGIS